MANRKKAGAKKKTRKGMQASGRKKGGARKKSGARVKGAARPGTGGKRPSTARTTKAVRRKAAGKAKAGTGARGKQDAASAVIYTDPVRAAMERLRHRAEP